MLGTTPSLTLEAAKVMMAAAEAEARKVEEGARAHWEQILAEVEQLRDKNQYERAIAALEPVIRNSTDRYETAALRMREEIAAAQKNYEEQMARMVSEARAAELRKAREMFENESISAHASAMRYDFRGAVQKMRSLCDALTADEKLKARAERRLAELQRADRFKKNLILAIKDREADGTNRSGFKTEYVRSGQEGTIEDAGDSDFMVVFKAGGVEYVPWDQLDPPAF